MKILKKDFNVQNQSLLLIYEGITIGQIDRTQINFHLPVVNTIYSCVKKISPMFNSIKQKIGENFKLSSSEIFLTNTATPKSISFKIESF
jgi:hypothetical protein